MLIEQICSISITYFTTSSTFQSEEEYNQTNPARPAMEDIFQKFQLRHFYFAVGNVILGNTVVVQQFNYASTIVEFKISKDKIKKRDSRKHTVYII